MQFSTAILALAIGSAAAMPRAANLARSITDLPSCLAHADAIPADAAQTGFRNGCHAKYEGASLHGLTRRSFPDAFDAFGFEKRELGKRCSDEHAACCCFQFCYVGSSCPECTAGCVSSCTAQYGGDCTVGNDCGECSW